MTARRSTSAPGGGTGPFAASLWRDSAWRGSRLARTIMTDGRDQDRDETMLDRQAADWFARVHAESAEEADWLALEAWLAGAPEHNAAFARVERLWAELDELGPDILRALEPAATASVVPMPAARRRRQVFPHWLPIGAGLAASLVLAVFATMFMGRGPTSVYATTIGQTRTVALADGSVIHLNSASSIRVRLDGHRRRVTLAQGEAAFDVAKDPARPFVVTVGDQRVTVVGTEFDILRHDGRVAVTVRRGIVAVHAPRTDARLTPGQQMVRHEGQPGAVVRAVDANNAFAWRKGYVVYQNRPLAEVVADLGRYFAVPIRTDAAAGKLAFSGALMIDNEDAVIGRLEAFLPVRADRTGAEITLRIASAAD